MHFKGYEIETEYNTFSGWYAKAYTDGVDYNSTAPLYRMRQADAVEDAKRLVNRVIAAEAEAVEQSVREYAARLDERIAMERDLAEMEGE